MILTRALENYVEVYEIQPNGSVNRLTFQTEAAQANPPIRVLYDAQGQHYQYLRPKEATIPLSSNATVSVTSGPS